MEEHLDGDAIKRRLFGEGARRGRGAMDELAPDVAALVDETLWRAVWPRPGIDLRTKSLCTITALLSMERFTYARAHMYGARNLGVTRDELTAVVVHLLLYIGLPGVHEGLRLVADVYADPDPLGGGAIPFERSPDEA